MNNISNFNQIFNNLYQAIRNINIELDSVKKEVLLIKQTKNDQDYKSTIDNLSKSIKTLEQTVTDVQCTCNKTVDTVKDSLVNQLENQISILVSRIDLIENKEKPTEVSKENIQEMIDMSINALLSSLSNVPSVDVSQSDVSVLTNDITVEIPGIVQSNENKNEEVQNVLDVNTITTKTTTKKAQTKGRGKTKKIDS